MKYRLPIKESTMSLVIALQLMCFPIITFADTTTPETTPQAQTTPTPGPQKPTGPEASTYTYNETTGKWENDHYTWDPVTKQTQPKEAQDYSYNPATGMWDTNEWRYDAPARTYVEQPKTVSEAPAASQIAAPSSPTVGNGAESTNTSIANGTFDLFYNAGISNNISSQSQSGNANVTLNTLGGSAQTGDAMAMANIINMLQSSWGLQGNDLATFTSNINGDVFGDLQIDPNQILGNTPLSIGTSQMTQLDTNIANNSGIVNNVDLAANSGNAGVTSNTTAGDATTGSANAVANVVNLINSIIASGQSFVGAININGSLNGDILLPEDIQNQLLASNAKATTLDTTNLENSKILADLTNNQTIKNNISADAESGEANVANNTSAGSATTGNTNTNLTILNMTGQQVVGKNALLVFVNVLGEWVGMIVNAPAGATAAALGDGTVTTNGAYLPNSSLTASNNASITNNINLAAKSGDADVSNNTRAGNATSGDATASANVFNMIGSQFSLANWFGILFINVFGSWNGSFGIDTASGNSPNSATNNPSSGTNSSVQAVKVFHFVPSTASTYRLGLLLDSTTGNGGSADTQTEEKQGAVLASSSHTPKAFATSSPTATQAGGWNWFATGAVLIGLSLLGTERFLTLRERRTGTAA